MTFLFGFPKVQSVSGFETTATPNRTKWKESSLIANELATRTVDTVCCIVRLHLFFIWFTAIYLQTINCNLIKTSNKAAAWCRGFDMNLFGCTDWRTPVGGVANGGRVNSWRRSIKLLAKFTFGIWISCQVGWHLIEALPDCFPTDTRSTLTTIRQLRKPPNGHRLGFIKLRIVFVSSLGVHLQQSISRDWRAVLITLPIC